MDPVDLKVIQKLIRMMARGEVTELEIDDANSGLKVRLRRGEDAPPQPPLLQLIGGGQAGFPAYPGPGSGAATGAGPEAPPGEEGLPEGTEQVQSPMVGTFYRATSPDSTPFVTVGSEVSEGDVLCIIEAMKVMNEIKAETGGEVVEILVENGEPVEFGQPLFLLKTR